MKKLLFYLVIPMILPILAIGQEKQSGETSLLYQSLIPTDKQSLLKDVDVIFNSRFAFNNQFQDGDYQNSNFNIDQLRFEIKGKIHEKVKFRFRNRYTKNPVTGSQDDISKAVDLAFMDFEVAPRTNFTMGKLCADWGGYEFDFNPIDILQYNDILDYTDNFLTGAGIYHKLKDNKNSFGVQILNSRNNTFSEQYPNAPAGVTEAKLPLAFVGTWRGSFFGGKFETAYSYSYFNEASGDNGPIGMNYIALGNKFKPSDKFVLYYDFQYSVEEMDRTGIVSDIVNSNSNYQTRTENVYYIEHWLRGEYLVTPKINLLLTLMTSQAHWKDIPDSESTNTLRTSYGYIPTIQYMPYKNMNLKFYLSYTGRVYDYSDFAVNNGVGIKDYNTGRLSFGIIAPLLVL